MLNIGFVGVGGICDLHANDIKARPDLFTLKAAADVSAAGLQKAQQKYGITQLYADYHELLRDPGIDAVLVAVPHDLHEQVCTDAFAAGKHVLVEKPIARTLQEADHIIAAADKACKVLLVGHNERYIAAYVQMRKIVDSGALGNLFAARADHFQNFNPPAGSWWRNAERVGGGCVIGSGIHRLDLLLWYLGDAEEVFAYQSYLPQRLEAEAHCSAAIRFKNGASAEFFCNWGIYQYLYYESLALYGEMGLVCFDGISGNTLKVSIGSVDGGKLREAACPAVPSQWEHFAECIQNGVKPLVGGSEARKALALVLAINASAKMGRPVKL